MKQDFQTLNKSDLRAYVIAHPDDKEAFYAFVDSFTKDATSETFFVPRSTDEVKEIENLVSQKVRNSTK